MKGSIFEIIYLLPADCDPSLCDTAFGLLERTDILEKLANNLDANVSQLEEYVVDVKENIS